MKKTAFLFLLSLTLCLSKPAEPQGAPTQAATNALTEDLAKQKEPSVPVKEEQPAQIATDDVHKNAPPQNKPTVTGTETASQQPNTTKTLKPDDSNKTSDKKEDKTEKTPAAVTPSPDQQKNTTEAKPITEKPVTYGTTAKDTPKSDSTTPKNEVTTKLPDTKSTEAPKADADKHTLQARGFDGPSFIGGMVLTLGLLAVGFMGFKYYKNQTERNYHTL